MKKAMFLLVLLFSIITSISCSEPNLTFADINPLFLADFPYRDISMNSIKGKIFYEFDESFELDQNGRRSYGDTYSPSSGHTYYFFDSNGRISRWLKETIQNNQVISSIDSLYSYNRDGIQIKVTKFLEGYQPVESEYYISMKKQNESIVFERKMVVGIKLDGPGFSFNMRTINDSKNITDIMGRDNSDKVENGYSAGDNNLIVRKYISGALRWQKVYTNNGILLSETLHAKSQLVYNYSIVEGKGLMQFLRDGAVISDSVLERRLNPAGFLEFEQITKKDGGVSTYRAEIIDAKE